MTTKPLSHLEPILEETDAREIIQFPDAPPPELTAYYAINSPGYPPSLADHFGDRETTIITSEVAAALIPYAGTYEGVRYPDLLIAFNVNPAANKARKGYLIPEQGKPPDFVMELASESVPFHLLGSLAYSGGDGAFMRGNLQARNRATLPNLPDGGRGAGGPN